jgi:hypothetical protein
VERMSYFAEVHKNVDYIKTQRAIHMKRFEFRLYLSILKLAKALESAINRQAGGRTPSVLTDISPLSRGEERIIRPSQSRKSLSPK